MKNFVFPQIFQPVLEDSSVNIATQWQMTSRRIQTEMEISNNKMKTHQKLKSSRHNLIIGHQQISTRKQLIEEQINRSEESYELKNEESSRKSKVVLTLSDEVSEGFKMVNQPSIKATQSKNIKSIKKVKNLDKALRSQDKKAKTMVKSIQLNKSEIQAQQKVSYKSKKVIKEVNQSKENTIGEEEIKNGKKSKRGRMKVTFGASRKNLSNQHSQKTIGKSQNSIRGKSKKTVEGSEKEMKSISSKKHLQKQRRRFAVERDKLEVDFEPTTDIKKVILSNQMLILTQQGRNRSRNQQAEEVLESQCTIVKIESNNDTKNKINSRNLLQKRSRNRTYHSIQPEKQVRFHKRSYTIWDIRGESSCSEDQSKSSKKAMEKSNENQQKKKKKNKKVHFGRTSIEEKTQMNKNLSNKQIQSHLRVKLTGIPKRSRENTESMMDFGEIMDKNTRKMNPNQRTNVKKASIVRKQEVQNVYSQLNYFRMRLNATEREQQEFEVSKPLPQAILFSVENVLHEIAYERILRTKRTNMMIDFGVKLTRDCMIKQTGAKERIVNCVV